MRAILVHRLVPKPRLLVDYGTKIMRCNCVSLSMTLDQLRILPGVLTPDGNGGRATDFSTRLDQRVPGSKYPK